MAEGGVVSQVTDPTEGPSDAPKSPPHGRGLAVASLACGLFGLCTFGASAIVGLVLGIVALGRMRAAGAPAGRGLAVGGIVTSGFAILVGLALLKAVVVGSVSLVQEIGSLDRKVPPGEAVGNVAALCKAAMAYASLNDGRLPAADTWLEDLEPYLRENADSVRTWPATSGGKVAYCMNRALAGMRVDEIPERNRTVLFFITKAGGPSAGGRDDLADFRTGWLYPKDLTLTRDMAQGAPLLAFGFADGNAELVLVDSSPIRVDELIWDPKAPTQGGKP